MDGSKTMHCSTIFRPKDYLPILPKSAKNEIVYTDKNDIWELRSDGQVLKRFVGNNLTLFWVPKGNTNPNQPRDPKKVEVMGWG